MEPKLTNVETTMFEENIRKYPNWNEDDIIITEISQIEFAAKEVKHHEWCRAKYQTEAESIFQSKHSKTPTDASSTHSQFTTNGIKKEKFTLKLLMLSEI